jgi:hypothetical protein
VSKVVSISSRKRHGAIPVYLDIQHLGQRSVVTLIDPGGCRRFGLPRKRARALEAALKARVGDEPTTIVTFLKTLNGRSR